MTSGDLVTGPFAGGTAGSAWDFDGTDDEAEASGNIFAGPPSEIAISWWSYSDVVRKQSFFGLGGFLSALPVTWDGNGAVRMYSNNSAERWVSGNGEVVAAAWQKFSFNYSTSRANYWEGYKDGALMTPVSNNAGAISTTGSVPTFSKQGLNFGFTGFDGKLADGRIRGSEHSADWVSTEYNNQSSPSTFYTASGVSGGSTTITGSGVVQAQSSTVSGTGEREVTGSGSPQAEAATVSGTGAREITTSGSVATGESTVSGTVDTFSPFAAALTAEDSSVSGTAERVVTGSGTVTADPAETAGTAARVSTSSGALEAGASDITANIGINIVAGTVTSSGSLSAGVSSTPSSEADRVVTSAGTPASGQASASGAASRVLIASGGLEAGDSEASGSTGNAGNISATGVLSSGDSSVSGAGSRGVNASGGLSSDNSEIGSTILRTVVVDIGTLSANDSRIGAIIALNGEIASRGGTKSIGISTGRPWHAA
jgi:hypothetical protein